MHACVCVCVCSRLNDANIKMDFTFRFLWGQQPQELWSLNCASCAATFSAFGSRLK